MTIERNSVRRVLVAAGISVSATLGALGPAGALPMHEDGTGGTGSTGSENGHVHKHDAQEVAAKAGGESGTVLAIGAGAVAAGAIGAAVVIRKRRRTPAA